MPNPRSASLTALDESFAHQLVAPRSTTQHMHPRWAERTYFLLHVADDLTINAGRQLYRHAGHWNTFASGATPTVGIATRDRVPFGPDDDPDRAVVGPLRIEVVRPLEELRLILDDPASALAYDLRFEGRFPPVAHDPTLVEHDGEVVTDTMSFFQSGRFSGTVALDGREWRVDGRSGFRDRSWGVRKHDGSPGRGLVLFIAAEFEDEAVYLLLLETASGRRAFTAGWALDETGIADTVASAEHDLDFAPFSLDRGHVDLTMGSGRRRRLEFTTQTRLFLSGVGYSSDPAAKEPGVDRFELSDPATHARLEGQTDHGSTFRLDGMAGHGYVEVGRGTHARYRPQPRSE
jgi:hypothetical protein